MQNIVSSHWLAARNLLLSITQCVCAIFASSALLAYPARAAGLPEARVPDAFGVSIHGLQDPAQEAAEIREAGFRIVRLDLTWQQIEKQRGVFDFSKTDALVDALSHEKLRPLFVLIYSNSLYEEPVSVVGAKGNRNAKKTAAPNSEQSRAAYAAFSVAAVKHYGALNPIWEIWNEPDRAGSWPPDVDANQYAKLANDACSAMRKAKSNAVIIGPAAADVPPAASTKFLTTVLDSGLGSCLDGISVHPYLFVDQLDHAPAMWDSLRALIAAHTSTGSSPPPEPVSSEWGLSTYRQGLTEATQASYLVRMMLLDLSKSIRVNIWYDWRDDGDDPHNPEHRYGLLAHKGGDKPAITAMKVMTTALDGAHFVCSLGPSNAKADSTQLLFAPTGSTKRTLVAWSRDNTREWHADSDAVVSVDASLPVDSAIDLFGAAVPTKRVGSRLLVGPATQPVFLKLRSADGSSASPCPATAQP